MKFLLIGKYGQLGWELMRTCMTLGEIVSVDYPEVDLANSYALRELVQTVKPDILLNPAAYTAVEKAESEFEVARLVNGVAPGVLAEEMKKLGGALIHYSTDYVFDGEKGSSYIEKDAPNPINAYGVSKLEGEQQVAAVEGTYLIFRTSWVYSLRRAGFISKVLNWARTQEVVRIVDDQIGSPTWARMLAQASAQVIIQGGTSILDYLHQHRGLYHLAGAGAATRYEWAKAVVEFDPHKEEQVVKQILPAKSADFPAIARRPVNSALNCDRFEKTFNIHLPDWKSSIRLLMG